ncbi:uncharacterized protein [Hetaerina americana]|uniref:uncharacterized protein n=1 Tax=Hetaerina americana TaxID=62018 RepID=UPI003A7F1F17
MPSSFVAPAPSADERPCVMGRQSGGSLLCGALLVVGVIGSPRKPAVEEGTVILPVDPCELLLNGRSAVPREDIDQENLRILAMGCLTRVKRGAIANSGYSPERPKARDTRGLFLKFSRNHGGLIYPGTKWCGPGDVARNYWDLGKLADEDRCCRTHDHCPESIAPGRCTHGICNTAPFTRSHCECDERFRQCLQTLKSPAADTIGALYFNVGNPLCFAEDEEDNDFVANTGNADLLVDRLGLDFEANEMWPTARGNLDTTLGQMQRPDCSRRSSCRYKFYTQKHFTEAAADGENVIPTAVIRPRIYQHKVSSQDLNLLMDKRSSLEDRDHQAAEILSKFLHRLLRSTGILRPRF